MSKSTRSGLALLSVTMLAACARHQVTVAPVRTVTPTTNTVRRLAPDFVMLGAGNRAVSSKQLRGQPVVILLATSADSGALRKQADRIERLYLEFSARKTVFVGAFVNGSGRVASNVPYIIAENGTAVAKAYGVSGAELAVIVIGADGNVDLVSTQVEAAQRILDVIINNYSVQAANRGGLGS